MAELILNNPITEEQWDIITDVDFDHTDKVTFFTKHHKEVEFVKVVRCKDCKYMTEHYDTGGNVPYWTCSEWDGGTDFDGYCHYGERKGEVEE